MDPPSIFQLSYLFSAYDFTSQSQEKATAPHSSPLAWKIQWMEEPGRLQSIGSLRVRHNRETSLSLFTFMHWRRKWQPTPVFLPGESQGQWSLVGCCLWGRTKLDMTEATWQQQQHSPKELLQIQPSYPYSNQEERREFKIKFDLYSQGYLMEVIYVTSAYIIKQKCQNIIFWPNLSRKPQGCSLNQRQPRKTRGFYF